VNCSWVTRAEPAQRGQGWRGSASWGELGEKVVRSRHDGGDGSFDGLRRSGRSGLNAADFADELAGGSLNFFGSGRRLKAAQRGDVATHLTIVAPEASNVY
jgi:hypothetical protein